MIAELMEMWRPSQIDSKIEMRHEDLSDKDECDQRMNVVEGHVLERQMETQFIKQNFWVPWRNSQTNMLIFE